MAPENNFKSRHRAPVRVFREAYQGRRVFCGQNPGSSSRTPPTWDGDGDKHNLPRHAGANTVTSRSLGAI